MDESAVRDCLLARSVEELDTRGALVGERRRVAATREAREEGAGDREGFLAARARRLIGPLLAEDRAVARVRELSGRAAIPGWLAFGLAFLVGWMVDRIGAAKRIDVLAWPLLGLLLWNVGVYVVAVVLRLRAGRGKTASASRGSHASVVGWITRTLALPARRWSHKSRGERAGLVGEVLERYLRDWGRVGAALHAARARLALHAGAAGLAAGVVGGTYVRGLVLEYRASWESTFLSADAVHALVSAVLGPAAWLTGQALPSVDQIAAMQWSAGVDTSVNAAPWIHLYAVTIALWILAPRLVLAGLARHRARRLTRDLPVDWEADPYFLRLCAGDRGGGRRADILPYSYKPSARAAEGLQALLLDLLGNRTRVEQRSGLEYGAERLELPAAETGTERCCALLFNLGQSPEQEVQGELVEHAMHAAEAGTEHQLLLVVVDESPYRARLGAGVEADERVEERRRSWQRVLRECGLEGLFLELDGAIPPDALGSARAALWPPAREGGRG